MPRLPYVDRREAGRVLAGAVRQETLPEDLRGGIVLGLPRGGVEVADEVARSLGLPLDVLVVRKLGAPGSPELALGAIASGGGRVLNRGIIESLGVDHETLEAITADERAELARREQHYRGDRPPLQLAGRPVILVDDGLATGATMTAAIRAVSELHPAPLICAVPIAAADVRDALATEVDAIICPATPEPFIGVGRWYEQFNPTSDSRVRELLEHAQPTTQ